MNIHLNPRVIMVDFEKAAINAFRIHFPNAEIKGCWFHFTQAIHRKSKQIIGNKSSYIHKEWLAKFYALALTPITHLREALAKIHITVS